ncbi:MAG: cell division protein ZapA [Acidobacteria bacterium]|nr:cell division protein ZapA [Acidobacteriota bacterium]MDW7985556.1 cell division protein ZapA [Acidobacteriota bacterium]
MPVRVQILGVQLQLRTTVPHDVLLQVLQDVEARARQIMEITRETNRSHVFLITALNLALELHEARQSYRALSQTAGHLLKELQACLQEESREASRLDILATPEESTD